MIVFPAFVLSRLPQTFGPTTKPTRNTTRGTLPARDIDFRHWQQQLGFLTMADHWAAGINGDEDEDEALRIAIAMSLGQDPEQTRRGRDDGEVIDLTEGDDGDADDDGNAGADRADNGDAGVDVGELIELRAAQEKAA